MVTQIQPNMSKPEVPSESSVDVMHPNVQVIQPKKSNQLLIWGTFFLFLFLFSMFSFMVYKRITAKPVAQITPTPTIAPPTPTLTPHRAFSSIATTSAFTTLDDKLILYTKDLSEFSVVDPNIAPPSLVLPLDYKK